ENDANPFKGQPSHGRVVPLAPLPLLSIVTSRPLRVGNRMTGPFVKTLPHKLRTSPAKMYPLLFPASFHHRRDPTIGLYFLSAGVTFPLRPERCQQASCQHRSRSGERFKDEKVRMRCRRLLDLAVQIRNPPNQTSDYLRIHLHHRAFRLNHRSIPNRWNRLSDSDQTSLDQFWIATALLAEEPTQPFRRNLLHFLQPRPTP